jgi:hypothetical protein
MMPAGNDRNEMDLQNKFALTACAQRDVNIQVFSKMSIQNTAISPYFQLHIKTDGPVAARNLIRQTI